MIARLIVSSVIAISLLDPIPAIPANLSTQTQTTSDSQVEKIKSEIAEIGVGEIVTVLHINGEKLLAVYLESALLTSRLPTITER
jgi:LEA14-like dessication related protein